MLLEKHLRHPKKKSMRRIRVHSEPIPEQGLRDFLRVRLDDTRERMFRLMWDINVGLHNRFTKLEEGMGARMRNMEEKVRELEEKITRLESESQSEEERGRGVSILCGKAPLTQEPYEAEAA